MRVLAILLASAFSLLLAAPAAATGGAGLEGMTRLIQDIDSITSAINETAAQPGE